MSNFIEEYKKGQSGGNKGIPLGPGLASISNAINGTQKGRIFGVASAPKVGKSTFVNYAFVIQPYLYSLAHNLDVEWLYFSFEIDRVSIEFDFATYFLYNDFGITHVSLEEGVTKNGEPTIELSSDYLRGRIQDDNGDLIRVKESIENILKTVYESRIIPIFGEYSDQNIQIKSGKVLVIESRDNPTGLRNYLLNHARRNGQLITKKYGNSERFIGYISNNPEKYTIIITDHLRKLIPERGWQMKQVVDKYIEYTVELRNLLKYTFIHIIHTNRNLASQERIKFAGDMLYPTAEDVKETGNLSEDADYLFTIFNPNDDRYKLTSHFGIPIRDSSGNEIYPNMRTVHLVESRHTHYPQHFKTNMIGNLKSFEPLNVE